MTQPGNELSSEKKRALLAQLLAEKHRRQSSISSQQCIHHSFEIQVERSPETVAVVLEQNHLTYRELNRRANQLAHQLRSLGVGPGANVGICMERSLEMIVGLLGILKAGGAYLPLMPTDPPAYLTTLVTQIPIVTLLTQPHLEVPVLPSIPKLYLTSDWQSITLQEIHNPDSSVQINHLAYTIPSANQSIQVEHQGIAARLAWLQQTFTLFAMDVVLQNSFLTQDTAIWEIFWPLLVGGRLVLTPPPTVNKPIDWPLLIRQQEVNLLHLAPSTLLAFINTLQDSNQQIPSLRQIICSGGQLRQTVVNAFFQLENLTQCNLHYFYHLPEAAGEITAQLCQAGSNRDLVPLGHSTYRPLYLLDKQLQPVPQGAKGEIYVGGEGLAREAQLTNQAMPCPTMASQLSFVENPLTPGTRWLKTGDLGHQLNDNTIEWLGALHRYAWVDGFRVDLTAIEATLLMAPSVAECVVLARDTSTFQSQLVAYIVPSRRSTSEQLPAYLQTQLPTYMLPSAYVPISSLPLTSTGQVDEPALMRLEVIDATVIQRWEQALRDLPDINKAAVVVQERNERLKPLHLSELLPHWSATATIETTSVPSFTEPPVAEPELPVAETADLKQPVMAFSDGGPLVIDPDAPKTLTAALIQTATQFPKKGIFHIQSDGSHRFQSYADLLEAAKCILNGLTQQGLRPNDRAILQIDRLSDYLATFWACLLGGITPVTVAVAPRYDEKSSVVNKLFNTWQLLDQPPILASETLVEPLTKLPHLLSIGTIEVLSVSKLRQNLASEARIHPSQPADVAFFQLTSGSTGIPKCIQETHQGIICHIHASQQFNGYCSDDISLNWLPMDHVVPVLTCHLKDVYLGCQQVEVPTALILSNPLRWLDLIEQYQVTHSWAPNFGFKLVSDHLAKRPDKSWNLSSLKFFMNAGEQVTLPVVRDFLNRMATFNVPTHVMQPAFGMAEVCTCMTYQNHFDFETGVHHFDKSSLSGSLKKVLENNVVPTSTFVDLGPPIPGVQIRITDANNQLLPEGVIGRFQIKGNVVTPGYFKNPAANQEAFVGDGWFNSGDLGFIQNGHLTLTGREKEIIIIHGVNYYCYEIEDVVNGIEGVEPTYVGAGAIDDPNTGTEGLAIFFTPKLDKLADNISVIKEIRTQITTQLGISPAYVIPVAKSAFPKTTSGKIQRTQLKQRLETGSFQDVLKEIDILLENANTLPDWFYQPVWRAKLLGTPLSQRPTGSYLIFLDSLGLGNNLYQKLASHNSCIRVEIGSTFSKLSATHYRIVPSESEHYQRLITALAAEGVQVSHILHLWTYDEYSDAHSSLEALQQAQVLGVYSLLFLVQALATTQLVKSQCQLQVISSYLQPTLSTNKIAYEKSTLVGLLKTIPLELSWLHCRHLDLEVESIETNTIRILQELCFRKGEPEVAYRGNQRLISSLAKVDMRQQEKPENPIKWGGIYLVTGGLGGIGVHLAQLLLEKYQVKLILVGRTALPERETWSSYLRQETRLSKRLRNYLALEAIGEELIYHAADVCDLTSLQHVVAAAESKWNESLSGIIHLAGVLVGTGSLGGHWEVTEEHGVVLETQSSFEAVLHSKVYGTWTLYQLLKHKPTAVFISFSSVNSLFGAPTLSAYCAANSFVDCYSRYQQHLGHRNTYCFNWTMWDELGVSEKTPAIIREASRAKGYQFIAKQPGLHAWLAGLSRSPAQLIVGLDSGHALMTKFQEKSVNLNKLTAYFSLRTDELPVTQLQTVEIPDRFGTPIHCDFVPLQNLPLTDTGAIDKDKLVAIESRRTLQLPNHIEPRTDVERLLVNIWQTVLGVSMVGIKDNFFELGGNSLLLVQIQSQLQECSGYSISTVELFQYPTIQALAAHLTHQSSPQTVAQKSPPSKMSPPNRQTNNEIAIIGMAGRFPQAKDLEVFWQNLCDGVESIELFSEAELVSAGVDPITLKKPNYVKAGTVLPDVEWFDAPFFDLSPREAEVMDPQHRLFLECAWEALEQAGYEAGTEEYVIGVYGGVDVSTYLLNNIYPNRDNLTVGTYQIVINNDKDYMPTRVSYKLNLKGPSVTIQTTCSTSLVAIHLACQSLLLGECDIALAGGVGVHLPQETGYLYQEGMIYSPDGHCRAFDAKAQGTAGGQGVGIVVLKRLAEAIAEGDYIHAIIKGSAINNDGSVKVGYAAPSVEGQASVIAQAQAMAGVEADMITYVETHGTGTSLGDPIEIAALTQAFRTRTQKQGFCAIGSVKTNIGHAGAAAGVAGLIKTVLALKHQLLPPSLNFEQPNPKIDFAQSPFYVNTALSEWQPHGIPRLAGVSSFGVGGTNAHLIVAEPPLWKPSSTSRPWQLLVLSAKTPSALETATHNLAKFLEQSPDTHLADVAYTLSKGRKPFNYRRQLVCHNLNQAIVAFNAGDSSPLMTQVPTGTQPIVFMFSGQGAQYVNMGLELYQNEPIFREQVDYCSEYLKSRLELDLRQILYPKEVQFDEATQRLNQTALTQVALFVIEYALAQLWMAWGVFPHAMIGHSIGEYVAACLAKVFSLEDALSLVAMRGQLMQNLPTGAMLAVSLSELEVQPYLSEEVSLAAINGPSRCVIAGLTDRIASLQTQLTAQGVVCRRLHTSHAFHSKMMEPVEVSFTEKVKQVELNPPQMPYISNVTGTWITAAEATHPSYWAKHLRQTVRFSDGLQVLLADSARILLEVGPGRTLRTLARQHPKKAAKQVILDSLHHPQESQSDVAMILSTLGQLWAIGVPIDWSGFYANESRQRLPLPTYPFERQRYWIEPPQPVAVTAAAPAVLNLWQSVVEAVQNQVDQSLLALENFISHYPAERASLDRLCLAYMSRTLRDLGAFSHPQATHSRTTFCQQFDIDPHYWQLISHWLTVLVARGELQEVGDTMTQLQVWSTEAFQTALEANKHYWVNEAQWSHIQCVNEHLMALVLRGEKEPRELIVDTPTTSDSLPTESPLFSHYNAIMRSGLQAVLNSLPTSVGLRILEIGGGSGITTKVLLPILAPQSTHYTFTDVTPFFLREAQQKFNAYPFVQYRLLDIDRSPQEQGYKEHSFDIVVATLMLHVTKNISKTIQHVRSLLAPGGLFFIWEITQTQLDFDITYAFLMNQIEDGERNQCDPFLSKQQWCQALLAHGFAKVVALPETTVLEHHIIMAQADLAEQPAASSAFTAPLDQLKPVNAPLSVGKQPNISDWFYRPTWQPSRLSKPQQSLAVESSILVFDNESEWCSQLIQQLESQHQTVIRVTSGTTFFRVSQHQYLLNPNQADDYVVLLKELDRLDQLPKMIIHLWLLTPSEKYTSSRFEQLDQYQTLGFYSLLFLAQAIGKQNINNQIQITVISNHLQSVIGSETLCPEKATILGPVRMIPQEYPNITCRSIDVVCPKLGSPLEKILTEQMMLELATPSSDSIIAYRGHQRWVRVFESLPLESPVETIPPLLREDGVYLITGGLGGIGLVLAEYLAKTVRAKLILTGRSEFPDRSKWSQWLTTDHGPTTNSIRQKILKIQELEQLGAEVLIICADVTHQSQMQTVVTRVNERFGSIHGVIHAAGIPPSSIIQQKTLAMVESVFAPKVLGMLVLDSVLQDVKLDFMILCSSIAAIFGGILDHCAANAFLDAFAHYNTYQGNQLTISINWDGWLEVGQVAEAIKRRQYDGKFVPYQDFDKFILPTEGVEVFSRILGTTYPQVITSTRNLHAPFESDLEESEQICLTKPIYQRPYLSQDYVAPRNELEQKLVDIWQDFFGMEQLGIHDDFFELGGDSLTVVQLAGKLRETLQMELSVHDLMTLPNINALAKFITEM